MEDVLPTEITNAALARRGPARRLAADVAWMRGKYPGSHHQPLSLSEARRGSRRSGDAYEHAGDFERSVARLKPQYPRNDWVLVRAAALPRERPVRGLLKRMLAAIPFRRSHAPLPVTAIPVPQADTDTDTEVIIGETHFVSRGGPGTVTRRAA